MTIVAIGSIKGAPGVTTTALALAAVWPATRGVLVAEVDPDGGVIAARRELSLEPGVVTLAAALRRGGDSLTTHTQALGDNVRALVAPPSAEQARAALNVAGDRLWQAFDALSDDLLVDCGRLTVTSPVMAAARRAAITLLLARPRLEDIALLRLRVPVLRREGVDPRVVMVGDGPYHRDEVASAIDAPVIAALPADRRTAEALDTRSARGLSSRAPLLRSARHLAATVLAGDLATAGAAR
jgi:MinD-like ATPase involved in chromosome partitioning or flagellar assembly